MNNAEQARIYRHLDGKPLQAFYSIRIETRDDRKTVIFCSKIHRQKEVEIPHCYSLEFTDEQILSDFDLKTVVIKRWGNVWKIFS